MPKIESVLCVYNFLFDNYSSTIIDFNLEKNIITDDINFAFLRRNYAEYDNNFRQIIPYCIIKYNEKYGSYIRGNSGSESRLYETYSLGFGGHINLEDCVLLNNNSHNNKSLLSNIILSGVKNGIRRELQEELGISIPNEMLHYSGKSILIKNNKNINHVSNFHLGMIYILDLSNTNIIKKIHTEECIENLSFISIEEMKKNISKYELWSKIIINYLSNNI